MAQQFIELATLIIPQPFDGDERKLKSFIDSIELLNSFATTDHLQSLAISFVKTRLIGLARDIITNETTLNDVLHTLQDRIKFSKHTEIINRMRSLSYRNNIDIFCEKIEILAEKLLCSYLNEGIPFKFADSYVMKEVKSILCKNATCQCIKIIISSKNFDTVSEATANYQSLIADNHRDCDELFHAKIKIYPSLQEQTYKYNRKPEFGKTTRISPKAKQVHTRKAKAVQLINIKQCDSKINEKSYDVDITVLENQTSEVLPKSEISGRNDQDLKENVHIFTKTKTKTKSYSVSTQTDYLSPKLCSISAQTENLNSECKSITTQTVECAYENGTKDVKCIETKITSSTTGSKPTKNVEESKRNTFSTENTERKDYEVTLALIDIIYRVAHDYYKLIEAENNVKELQISNERINQVNWTMKSSSSELSKSCISQHSKASSSHYFKSSLDDRPVHIKLFNMEKDYENPLIVDHYFIYFNLIKIIFKLFSMSKLCICATLVLILTSKAHFDKHFANGKFNFVFNTNDHCLLMRSDGNTYVYEQDDGLKIFKKKKKKYLFSNFRNIVKLN